MLHWQPCWHVRRARARGWQLLGVAAICATIPHPAGRGGSLPRQPEGLLPTLGRSSFALLHTSPLALRQRELGLSKHISAVLHVTSAYLDCATVIAWIVSVRSCNQFGLCLHHRSFELCGIAAPSSELLVLTVCSVYVGDMQKGAP